MKTAEMKVRLLKTKIAVALQDEYKSVPTEDEINSVFLLNQAMYEAVLCLHYKRLEQKKSGQLALFLLRMSMLIGYARVSTLDQTFGLQQDALTAAGCEQLYTDTVSGSVTERSGLTQALSHLRAGDTL